MKVSNDDTFTGKFNLCGITIVDFSRALPVNDLIYRLTPSSCIRKIRKSPGLQERQKTVFIGILLKKISDVSHPHIS